jgi:ubiquinone biosynthesis O-methyltransferase
MGADPLQVAAVPMSTLPKVAKAQDAEVATPSSEFVWRHGGPDHIHGHMARPILVRLDSFGAKTVLDLGCGNGWLTDAMARCGFDVFGLDRSRSGIQIAQRSHPELPFRLGDATAPLDADLVGRFDAVVAVEVVDHVAQPRQLLQRAVSALRPGGLLLVSTPYNGYVKSLGLALTGRLDLRWQALQDHGRLKFFSRQTLTALMVDSGLQDIRYQAVGRVPCVARSMLLTGKKAPLTAT